jgi:hypothetical protein
MLLSAFGGIFDAKVGIIRHGLAYILILKAPISVLS